MTSTKINGANLKGLWTSKPAEKGFTFNGKVLTHEITTNAKNRYGKPVKSNGKPRQVNYLMGTETFGIAGRRTVTIDPRRQKAKIMETTLLGGYKEHEVKIRDFAQVRNWKA